MNSQSCEIHNVGIVGFPFMSLGEKNHFNAMPMGRSKLYYKEEGGSSPMSKLCECTKQICDPKLIPFSLTTCIVLLVQMTCLWSVFELGTSS